MAKASRSANSHTKSRQVPPVKVQSRSATGKATPVGRTAVESARSGWATDLVFDVREPKLAVSLRLDADVLRFFRGFGAGYQTRINEVLKAFMQARVGSENVGHAVAGARGSRGATGNGSKRAHR